jgi:hypothetical protein
MNSSDPLSSCSADNRVHTPRTLPVYLKVLLRLGKNIRDLFLVAVMISGLSFLHAEELKEARVTQIVRDVKLLPEQASPRPATVNDSVRDGTAVRTGVQSRSELTFTDQTITRLGANTLFSFKEGTRVMDLGEGAMLFQVPKGSGGATIRTAAVTAAITGTTGIGEFHHATSSNPHPVIKWLCLEGVIHLYLTNGSKESVELHPGEMEVTDGNKLTTPVNFDIATLVRTSLFFTGFNTTLPSLPLIAIEIQRQLDRLAGGGSPHNFLVDDLTDPSRIIEVVDQGITAQSPSPSESPTVSPTPTPTVSPTATPTPTVSPGKFGELVTITSPDPYVIGTDTTITTDPTITTNGQSDPGKIYRDPSQDGALSMYLFGSTSDFDTALDNDAELAFDGMAVFKFSALLLTGNPSVATNDGPDLLALVAVNGITSDGPGGVLTFDGIHRLLLATQHGSINLGSEISFSGLPDITFYARGANSMLILGSDVETTRSMELWGEGGIVLTGNLSTMALFASTNGNFDVDSGSISAQTISVMAGGNINFNLGEPLSFNTDSFSLQANGDIHVNNSLEITEDNAAQTGGFNISLFSGSSPTMHGTIAIDGELRLTIRANDIAGSALIAMRSGGDTTIDGDVNLLIDSTNSHHIAGIAAMTIGSGADFTANNFLAVIDNEALGVTGSANLAMNVTGDLTTNGFLDLEIANTGFTNSGEFVGGGRITNSAVISLLARNVSADDYVQAFIFNDGEGRIDGNALINGHVTTAITSKGDIFFDIENAADHNGENITSGGTIGGDASVIFSAGGTISAAGVVEFAVLDNDFRFLENGGSIDGDATVSVTAASIMAGDFFQPLINNTNGSVGGNAAVAVVVSGLTDVGSFGFFRVSNDAGGIGGDARFTFTGGNVSIGDTLFAEIQNRARGEIGGDAVLAFEAFNLTVSDTANFRVLNGDLNARGNLTPGGMIGGDAEVDVGVTNLTASILVADVENTGGQIGGDATVRLTATGSLNTGVAAFGIANDDSGEGAGTIGGDALVDISVGGNFITDTFAAAIGNQNGGVIGTSARISFNTSGSLTTTGDALFQIQGGFVGRAHILGAAALPPDNSIQVHAGAMSVGGSLDSRIDSGGAGIPGDATIDMNVSGSATVANDANIEILGNGNSGTAAINFNGGSYNVGGTFLANIDGNGTIAFNNASVHADVLKAGVFGPNGVLNIGGGTLSADTTLKLYASGSNGQLNFISNVTLGGNSTKILAANTITISNNVVVTIGGTRPADVYTGFTSVTPNANYTGFGGNGTTTGTFAGAGANNPQPLGQAPPFGTSSRPAAPTTMPQPAAGRPPTRIAHAPGGQPRNRTRSPRPVAKTRPPDVVNVRDSDELISLIHRSTQGSDQANAAAHTPRNVAGAGANGRNTANRTNAARTQVQVRSNLPSSAARLH